MELGYYRVLSHDPDDEDFIEEKPPEIGDIVYVSYIDEDGVHWSMVDEDNEYSGHSSWITEDVESFMSRHEFEPDGHKIRAKQIAEIMGEINQMTSENVQLGIEANNTLGLIGVGETSPATSNALITSNQPEELKKKMAALQAAMKKKSTAIALKQKKVQALVKEQEKALDAVARVFSTATERMNEFMWSINLYLGRDEEIALIREGEPADQETPISIRQLVLYMDEECALNADFGGLEFDKINEFDEWVSKPENFDRLIPEPRCVVALKPRHTPLKDDDMDPWEQAARDQANMKTYFLVRNGERAYRVCTELEVGENLFPTRNEFDEYFTDREGEPLTPGSRGYTQAMENANSMQRHYMRIVLFLQGLLDRTEVFHPLPGGQLNICDPRSQKENLRFVRDMEMVLTDGRPRFREWLEELNSQLRVGHRVVGAWGSWASRDETRVWPKMADYPDSYTIQPIEKSKGDEFGFSFEQEARYLQEEGYYGSKNWVHRKPKNKGSFWFAKSGKFYINFDLVNPDDVEYYLNDRLSRRDYMDMFPLLTRVRDMAVKEAKQEAPFRKLLTSTIRDTYKLDQNAAERLVNILVPWYKFKNKIHRSLKKDEKKAMRMIMKEAKLRLERDAERRKKEDDAVQIVELLKTDKTIFIGHLKGNEYVRVESANDDNVFVHETHANVRRIGGKLTVTIRETREWRTSSNNRDRWHQLYGTEKWDNWDHGARASEHLTGPEVEQVISDIVKKTPKIKGPSRGNRAPAGKERTGVTNLLEGALSLGSLPVVAYLHKAGNDVAEFIRLYFLDSCGYVPDRLLSGPEWFTPRVKYVDVTWKRKQGKFEYYLNWHSAMGGYDNLDTALNWAKGTELWRSEENYNKVQGLYKVWDDLQAKKKELRKPVSELCRALSKHMDAVEEKKAYDEFIEEFGPEADPLWEDQKKRLNLGHDRHTFYFDTWLDFLAERRIDPRGMTIREVIDKCYELGITVWKHGGYEWDKNVEEYVNTGKMKAPKKKDLKEFLEHHPEDYRFPNLEEDDEEELLEDSEHDPEPEVDENVQKIQDQAQILMETVLDGLRGIMAQ